MENADKARSRLPRYVRHRFKKPVLALQHRDLEIIRAVAQHRVISSDDLQLLILGSDQAILRRLQKLFHHGYLDRPRSQRQLGNVPMVYALGQRGAECLARESNGASVSDWPEKNRQISSQFIEHALMVSRFQAVLRHAIRTVGTVSLESWQPDGTVRESVRVEDSTRTERIPVAPDAFFTLRLLDEPEGRNRIHVFFEADRGTMTLKRFLTKMRGYRHYWRIGRQTERFGIRNFVVLTIALTQERAVNLRAVTSEMEDAEGRDMRMFLFGSEQDYTPNRPLRVLDPIWATASDDGLHSLLE